MERKPIMTVMYKGIKVPARMKDFGNGVSKLMPINTNRYTLHGIPRSRNLVIDAKTIVVARNIIKENKKSGDSKRIILAKYTREKKGFEINTPESISPKGKPVGVVVAFIYEDKLFIGWSKYLEGKTSGITWTKELEKGKLNYTVDGITQTKQVEKGRLSYTVKPEPKEPLIFTKKDATSLAIERGLVDTITFHGSIAYTKKEKMIPKSIVNGLDQFIERCQRYFKRDAFNVIINEADLS